MAAKATIMAKMDTIRRFNCNLPPPEVIAAEIIEDLQAALDQLKELEAELQQVPRS